MFTKILIANRGKIACRVDVSFVDDPEAGTASYRLDVGAWTCRFDNLGTAKEGGIDVRLQAVR